jgi:two-component system sensor kinase FixL
MNILKIQRNNVIEIGANFNSNMSRVMVIVDEYGVIQSLSSSVEAMFGFSDLELIGQRLDTLLVDDDLDLFGKDEDQFAGSTFGLNLTNQQIINAKHRNGSVFPMELMFAKMMIGNQIVYSVLIQNLTNYHEQYAQLQDLKSKLAKMTRANSMSGLAVSIAHEINQPLTAIVNYVETLEAMLADFQIEQLPTFREALDDCAKQGIRAGQIVRRLREFVVEGDADRQFIKLGFLIKVAGELAFVDKSDRSLDFIVDIDSCEDNILVDRIQMQQLLVNLFRNAIEAMKDSPVRRLAICGRRKHRTLEISIEDSGPGLAKQLEKTLFDPFVSSKSAGMGIGLSICRSIVESHGGSIWPEASTLGGAAFKFTLPEVFHD